MEYGGGGGYLRCDTWKTKKKSKENSFVRSTICKLVRKWPLQLQQCITGE
jgi:hypothetical protein